MVPNLWLLLQLCEYKVNERPLEGVLVKPSKTESTWYICISRGGEMYADLVPVLVLRRRKTDFVNIRTIEIF